MDRNLNTAEVWRPGNSTTCSLPSLPVATYDHSQTSLTLCGGRGARKSCYQFRNGGWRMSHSLREDRVGHSTWEVEGKTSKIYLLGGSYIRSATSTELLGGRCATKQGFTLKYNTK